AAVTAAAVIAEIAAAAEITAAAERRARTAPTARSPAPRAWAILGRVDAQRPPAQLVAVELLDCLCGAFVGGELDEGESARTPALPVHRQVDVADLANLGEKGLNFGFGGIEIEVTDEDF